MKPICPNCKSKEIDAIVFGIPLPSSLGDLAMGIFGPVEMKCKACGYRWVEKENEKGTGERDRTPLKKKVPRRLNYVEERQKARGKGKKDFRS
jgi:hypothetical protein